MFVRTCFILIDELSVVCYISFSFFYNTVFSRMGFIMNYEDQKTWRVFYSMLSVTIENQPEVTKLRVFCQNFTNTMCPEIDEVYEYLRMRVTHMKLPSEQKFIQRIEEIYKNYAKSLSSIPSVEELEHWFRLEPIRLE